MSAHVNGVNGAVTSPSLTDDEKETMGHLAASWAGLIRIGKTAAADEIESMGNLIFGAETFKQAMADAAGGQS